MTTLFSINHNSNNLNEYDRLYVNGARIYTAAGAALNGTAGGLGVQLVSDSVVGYGQKTYALSGVSGVTVNIRIDPNSLTMGSGDVFQWTRVLDVSTGSNLVDVLLYYSGSAYQVALTAYEDDATPHATAYYTISDAAHLIAAAVARASSVSSADGVAELSIDSVSKETISSLDNYDIFGATDTFRFGATGGVDTTTTGTFYLDEIVVTDDAPSSGVTVLPLLVLSGHLLLSGSGCLVLG